MVVCGVVTVVTLTAELRCLSTCLVRARVGPVGAVEQPRQTKAQSS